MPFKTNDSSLRLNKVNADIPTINPNIDNNTNNTGISTNFGSEFSMNDNFNQFLGNK